MKKGQIVLEELLRNESISGFNRTKNPFDFTNTSVLVLSNLHETEAYKEAVLEDLRPYLKKELDIRVNRKIGYTQWEPEYRIRDDQFRLFPGLRIKDKRRVLDLEKIKARTFEEAGFSTEYIRSLLGINDAYEIRIQSSNLPIVEELARIFIEKTSFKSANSWPDPYDVPVIFILGGMSIGGFLEITMYQQRRTKNSLNFVQRNLNKDIEKTLEENGFEQAPCLANSLFVERCCN